MSLSRIKAWLVVYNRWKDTHPDLDKNERTMAVRGCIRKIAYPNFWAAYLGAVSIQRDLGGKNCIYWCEICRQNHIGRYKGRPIFPKKLMRLPE